MTTGSIEQAAESNLAWNFGVNVLDVSFFTLAISLISRETIMPLFVSTLTDSKIAIGLIPAIYNLGIYLPQLLTASFVESLRQVKPYIMLVSGIGERIPYLMIGLLVLAIAVQAPGLMLLAFFLMLAVAAVSGGMIFPAWLTMIGKVFPTRRRGMFFGIGMGLGAFMGVLGAQLVGHLLETLPYPSNFSIVFMAAFGFMIVSFVGLSLNREPESRIVKDRVPLRRYLRQLPQVLRHNVNFRRFLISYSISKLGAMAVGFFVVFGNARFELSGTDVGILTAVMIGSQALMNLFWGWVGDRSGHKLLLACTAFALALAALVTLLAGSALALIATFALLGSAIASEHVAQFSIVLEFSQPEDQPTYIGLTNTLLAPATVLGPILGGWIATVFDYPALFAASLAIALLAGLMLLFWVREPRHIEPVAIPALRS